MMFFWRKSAAWLNFCSNILAHTCQGTDASRIRVSVYDTGDANYNFSLDSLEGQMEDDETPATRLARLEEELSDNLALLYDYEANAFHQDQLERSRSVEEAYAPTIDGYVDNVEVSVLIAFLSLILILCSTYNR
jgi:hypothetical protein